MTQHTLQGRTEAEVTWFRRREVLASAALWLAWGGAQSVHAQQRSNIVSLTGDALRNGQRLDARDPIQTGDRLETGPQSNLVFVIGDAAFQLRASSQLTVARGESLNAVSVLQLVAGAVVSVFGRGRRRQIVTPTLTAGIRGTGVYTEVFAQQAQRSYFCNCYGTVDMSANGDRTVSQSDYHQAFWGEVEPKGGRWLTPAKAINHTDEELEFLAGLLGLQTAWQAAGRRGVKDGNGYMEERPADAHPALRAAPRRGYDGALE